MQQVLFCNLTMASGIDFKTYILKMKEISDEVKRNIVS